MFKKVLIMIALLGLNSLFADRFCILTDSGAKIYKEAENTDNEINLPNRFGYGVVVGKNYNGIYEILDYKKTEDDEIKAVKTIGFIDEKYLICEKDNKNINTGLIYADKIKFYDNGKEKDSVLYKKALVVNSVKKSKGISKVTEVPIYSSSYKNDLLGQKGKLYEIYFILKDSGDRVLLSKYSYYSADSYNHNKDGAILGWVDKKFIKEWSSRVAIEPTVNSIRAYWSPRFDDKRARYRAKIDIPKKYYSFRYPLLEKQDSYIKINYMQKEGTFGDIRKKVTNIVRDKFYRIVFLVDATAGMQQYLNNVKIAIRKWLKNNNSKNVKVAIAVYRDYSDGRDAYRLITNGFVNPIDANYRLKKSRYFIAKSHNDSPGDVYNGKRVDMDRSRYEALFNGLISMYHDKKLKLSRYENPTRVILIGDHGNHPNDDKGLTAKKVAEKLGSNVEIQAIQVHTEARNKKYVRKFRKQVKDIIKYRNKIYKNDTPGSFIIDNIGSVNTVVSNISKAVETSQKTKNITLKYSKGLKLSKEEREFLASQLDIDVDNLGIVQQSIDLYIPKREKGKYKKVILARKKMVRKLSSAYEDMAEALNQYRGDEKTLKALKNGIKEAIHTLTGEELEDDENIAEFLKERLQIPKSRILNLTLNDWIDKIARNEIEDGDKNRYRIELVRKFRKDMVLLDAIYKERRYYDIKFDDRNEITYKEERDNDGFTKEIKRAFNISVVTGEGYSAREDGRISMDEWMYIPFEYLP